MRIRNLRPTPGALIGVIALVFALSGAAIAAERITTDEIAKRAVTGSKIAKDAVKSGKILDGKVKAKDLAPGVVPEVPETAYGRVDKSGGNAAPAAGAVGITGVAPGGAGVVCYDLAFAPVSGAATPVRGPDAQPGATAELAIPAGDGCSAPYTDASVITKASTTGNPDDRDVFVQFVR